MFYYTVGFLILMFKWSDAAAGDKPTQKQLVDYLRVLGFIKSDRVEKVLSEVDLENYEDIAIKVPEKADKKEDVDICVDSQYMYAIALEALKEHLKEGCKALHVACGSGYVTVCMSLMIGKGGYAVGQTNLLSDVPVIENTIKKYNPTILEKGYIKFNHDDVRTGFAADEGPFDVIYFGASIDNVPSTYLDTLKNGGRMFLPLISPDDVAIMLYDKHTNGKVTKQVLLRVPY